MAMLTQVLFLLGCVLTALATAATLALSPRPHDVLAHMLGLARLAVFGGSVFAAARCLEGRVPPPEALLWVLGTAIVYVLQARSETLRQRRRTRDGGALA